jgi:hypothetical protein
MASAGINGPHELVLNFCKNFRAFASYEKEAFDLQIRDFETIHD